MKELVEFVARSLVDHPDQVEVTAYDRERDTVLELHVAPDDLGKVIGRQGRTARALRSLVTAAGAKRRRRFQLEITE